MIIDHTFPNGIRFEGSDGWIFVTRGGERVTASDPVPKGAAAKSLQASKPEKEEFTGDDGANALRSRPQRAPYGIDHMKR